MSKTWTPSGVWTTQVFVSGYGPFGTLGDMISETFHAHHKAAIRKPNKKVASVSTGTSCESLEWETVTGVKSKKDLQDN